MSPDSLQVPIGDVGLQPESGLVRIRSGSASGPRTFRQVVCVVRVKQGAERPADVWPVFPFQNCPRLSPACARARARRVTAH